MPSPGAILVRPQLSGHGGGASPAGVSLFESLFRALPTAVIACRRGSVGPDGRLVVSVVAANVAAEALFGGRGRALIGTDVLALFTEVGAADVATALAQALAGGSAAHVRLEAVHACTRFAQDLTISRFDNGGILMMFEDHNPLGRAYDDLARREQELRDANRALDQQGLLLDRLAAQIAAARKAHDQEVSERRRLEAELRRLAHTDELTNIDNRRAFLQAIGHEAERARTFGHPLSLLYLDIDLFKSINDSHGHSAGDTVIRVISERIAGMLRVGVDRFGRLGGDEFAVALPGTTLAGARTAAERIRQAIAEQPVECGPRPVSVTVSIGIAELQNRFAALRSQDLPAVDETVEALVERADAALYEAKRRGRNAVWPLPSDG